MAQGKSIPRNFTLYESDMATLHQVGKDKGLASLSAALRYIIHDWTKTQAAKAKAHAQYEAGRAK